MGAGGRKEKPHNPLMISVQKVRIRPGKGKGKSDGWFPQPLTHNTRRVCTDDPENKLPMHSLCPTREWEREWYGVTTPNIISGQGVILFPFGATPPLIGEAEEVVAAEPLGAFNRDPNDLVLTVGGKLVVNHLLEHDFLSDIQLQSLLDDLDRVPLSEKAANCYGCNRLILCTAHKDGLCVPCQEGEEVCNYEANPRYCTFANSWSTPCREHSTCLYFCTVLLLRLVHET